MDDSSFGAAGGSPVDVSDLLHGDGGDSSDGGGGAAPVPYGFYAAARVRPQAAASPPALRRGAGGQPAPTYSKDSPLTQGSALRGSHSEAVDRQLQEAAVRRTLASASPGRSSHAGGPVSQAVANMNARRAASTEYIAFQKRNVGRAAASLQRALDGLRTSRMEDLVNSTPPRRRQGPFSERKVDSGTAGVRMSPVSAPRAAALLASQADEDAPPSHSAAAAELAVLAAQVKARLEHAGEAARKLRRQAKGKSERHARRRERRKRRSHSEKRQAAASPEAALHATLPGSTPSSPASSPHVVFPVSAPSSPRTLSPPTAAAERGHRAFATQSHHAAAAAPPVPPPVESAYEPSSEAAADARIAELQRQLASAKAGQAASADSAREAERRLAAERQATQRRMESAQEAAASSESALAAANERARVAEVEAVHLRVAAARLEERLAATERERARAEDRATQAAASASTASEAAVSKWEARVMELEGRLQRSDAAWLAKLDTAKAQASLAAQNQAAEELSKAQAELAQLRGQLAAAKDDEGAAAKLAAAQAELAAVRQRSDAAVRAAEERAAAAHEERRQGAADLSRAHHKVSSLQDEVASLARERDALAAERDAAARARQEAATDAAQAGKVAASLRERMLASAERERELSSLLAAVRRELAETQVELGTAQEAAAEATAAASALRADNSRLAVQVAAVSPRRPRGSASSTGASTPLHTGGSVTLHSPDATGKPAQRPIDLEGSAFALDAPSDGSTEQGSSQRMSAAQQQLQRALQVAEADGDLSQVAPAAAEVQAAADALVGRAGGTGEGPKARITLPDGTVSDEADVLAVLAEVTQREQALAEEVEALRSRMAASDAARSASSSELDMAAADAATSTAALRGEIGKLVVARDEAAAEAEAAAARAAALEAELEEAREEAATQHARAEVAAAGARSAAEAAEAAAQQAAESRQALAQAQQEAAEAAAASVPRSELEAVRSELHSVQAELSQVTAARAAAEESAAATRAELRQVKAEAETAADEVQRLGSRLKAAQAATEDAEGRLESATADLRRSRVEAAAATEAAAVAEARTTSLTSALAQARQSTADAEGEVERHKAAATAARASGGEAATTLQLKLSSAEAAAEAAGAEAARAKAQVAELTAQLEQARAEAQAAREEAAAAKARLAEVQASMAQEGSAREAGLLAQLQEARAEADSTAQELAAVRAQRVELERQLKQARATASRHPAPEVTGLQTGRSSRAPSPPLSPASSTDRQGVLAALSATRSKSVERLRRGHSGQQGTESASGVEEVEVVDGPPTPEALGVGPLEGGGEPGRARSGAWAASSGGSEEEGERPRSARKQEAASTRKPQVVEEDLEPSEWDEWDEGSSPRPASQRRPGSGRTRSMSPRPTVTSGSKRRTGLLGGEGKVTLSPHSSDEGFDDEEWFASVQEGAVAPSGAKAGRTRTPGSKRKGRGSPRPGSSAGGRSLPRSSSRHSAAGFVGGGQPGSASDCSISDSGRRTSSRWEDRPPRQARPGSRGGIMRLDWGDSKAPSDEDSAPPRSQRSGAASHSSGQGRQGGPTAYSSREAGTDLDVEEFSAGDSAGRAAPPPSAAQAWAEAGRRPDAPASPAAADLETLLGALPTTRSERPHAFEDTLSDSARSPGRRSPASTGSAGRRKGQARTASAGEAWGRPPLRALGKASPRGGWEDDAGTPGDSGWEGSEGGRDSPQADEVSVEAVPTPYEVAAGSSKSPHAARGRAAAKRQGSPAAHPTHSTASSDQAPPRVVANAWGAADEALSTSKAPPAWQQPSPTPSWAAPAKQGGEPGRTGPATGSDSGRSDHGVSPRSAFDATSPRLAPKASPGAEEVVEEDLIEEELGSLTPVQPKQPQRSATPPGSPTGSSGQSRSPDVHRHYGGVEEEGGEDEAPSGAVLGATGGAVHATPSQRGAGDPGAVADTPAGPGRPARGGGSPGSPSLRRYSSTARPEVASPAAHAGGAADPVAAPAPLSSTTDAPLRTPGSGPGTPPPNLRVSQLRVPSLVDCTRAVCALSPEQRADVFHRKTVQRMEALLAGSVCIALGQGHDWAEFQRIMQRPDFPRAIQQCAQGPLPPDVEKKLKHEWNGQQMPSFLAAGSWNDPSMLVFRTLAQWVVALIQASKIARKSQGKAATPRGLPPPRAPVPATAAAAAAAAAGGGGDAPTAMPSASEDEGGRSVRDMPSASASEEDEEEEGGGGGGGGAEGDDAFLREAPSAAAASDAAADSDAQAVAREMAELAHFRAHMEKGLEVQKFTSKKSWLGRVFGPERRVLGIREQQAGERVVWVKDAAFTARALRDNERSLKVSDLREVRRGCDASATLRSKASPRDDDRVLSIVADSRTLDLQVADARTRTWLAHGIELLIKEHSGALPRRKAAEE